MWLFFHTKGQNYDPQGLTSIHISTIYLWFFTVKVKGITILCWVASVTWCWTMELVLVQWEQQTWWQGLSSTDFRMSNKESIFYWLTIDCCFLWPSYCYWSFFFFLVLFIFFTLPLFLEHIMKWIKMFSGDSTASCSPKYT